jgi:hypothetical protein
VEGQKYNYQACRVEFSLLTDLTISEPIRFDSLMATLWYSQHYFDCDEKLSPENIPLPIRKLSVNGQWFWDCSHSIIDVKYRQQDTLKKNIDNLDGTLRIDCGAGPYCSVFKKFERLTCDYVRFFVYGDLVEILKYAKTVNSLGGLRKDGFGWIEKVSVTPCNMQFCAWDSASRLLLRDIPADINNPFKYIGEKGMTLRRARCRPPYFKRYTEDVIPLISSGSEIKDFQKMVKIV